MLDVALLEEWFLVEDTRDVQQISVCIKFGEEGPGWTRRTGSATDSRCPQSITKPVILPTAMRASKWLGAKDTEGT